jgi:hypothetical protein
MDNLYIEINVTAARKKFATSQERGETEITMTIPQNVAESLDFGNIIKSQLQVAINDLFAKEAEKNKE